MCPVYDCVCIVWFDASMRMCVDPLVGFLRQDECKPAVLLDNFMTVFEMDPYS